MNENVLVISAVIFAMLMLISAIRSWFVLEDIRNAVEVQEMYVRAMFEGYNEKRDKEVFKAADRIEDILDELNRCKNEFSKDPENGENKTKIKLLDEIIEMIEQEGA